MCALCTSGTSMGWLVRAGPAGRLTPLRACGDVPPPWRYVTVSPRSGPAGPGSLDAGAMTSLVTDAWRKGRREARDLHPGLHPLCPRRADCRYREVTVPRRRGGAPQLCCLGSGRGRDCSLQRDLVIELFWHSVILPLGKSAGGSRTGGGLLDSVETLCGRPPMCSAQGHHVGPA